MIRKVSACSLIVLSFFLASCSGSIHVPVIENWKEIVYSPDSNNDPKDRGQIFIRWFEDPRGNEYEGMVLYRQLSGIAYPTPLVKAWNFKTMIQDGPYDWSEVRVALWLEDGGVWFVGNPGERLKISRQYQDDKTISITYTFNGANSSISKIVPLEKGPTTLKETPYPTDP